MMAQSAYDEPPRQQQQQQAASSAYPRQTQPSQPQQQRQSQPSSSFSGEFAPDAQQQDEVAAEFDAYAAAASHTEVYAPSAATLASAAVQRHAAARSHPSGSSSYSSPSSNAASRRQLGPSGVSLGDRLAFQYRVRIALALAPALAVVLAAGGKPLLLLLCVAGVAAYVIDALGSPEGAFVCVWVGTIAGMGSLALSNALKDAVGLWSTLLLVHCNVLLLFAALALTLCFAFMVQELLERRIERLLFGAAFMPLVTVELLAAVSALGVDVAPWALCAITAFNYAVLLRPLPSSQQLCELGMDEASLEQGKRTAAAAATASRARPSYLGGGGAPSEPKIRPGAMVTIPISEMDVLVSPLLSGVHALLVVVLPYSLFLTLHHARLFSHLVAAEGMLLLVVQVLVLAAIMKEDLLWFTGLSGSVASITRKGIVGLCSVLLVLLLEYRVILPVFGHLLYLRESWPLLCFVVLTAGLLAGLAALGLLYLGLDKHSSSSSASSASEAPSDGFGVAGAGAGAGPSSRRSAEPARVTLFKTLLHVSALCAGVSLGAPLYAYVFLVALAWVAGLVLLQQNPLAFAAGTALWCVGAYTLIWRTIGFLEFGIRQEEDAAHAAKYMFSSQANMLFILCCLAMLVPTCHLCFAWMGSHLAGASLRIDGGLLNLPAVPGRLVVRFLYLLADAMACLYVLVLAALEWDWTRMDRRALFDSPVYSWYLVLATSALGAALAFQLAPRRLGRVAEGTYVALVALNVWKGGVLFFDDRTDLWHFLAVVSAQVPLYLAYDRRDAHRAAVSASAGSGSSGSAAQGGMSGRAGVAHAATVVVSMWLGKNTVLAHVLHATGLHSSSTESPTESTYLALFLVGSAVGLLPLSFKHFRTDPRWRRWNVLGLMLSLLFFAIQPRLDFLGGPFALDPHSDVFALGMEVVAPRWPAWLLFVALATLLLSVSSVGAQMATGAAVGSAASSSALAGAATASFLPRPLLALALGSSLGIYLVGVYLPLNLPLYALLLATFNLAAVFLIYLFIRGGGARSAAAAGSALGGVVDAEGGLLDSLWGLFSSGPNVPSSSSMLLPAVYYALVALLPVTYVAIGFVYSTPNLYGASASSGGRGGRGAAGVGGGAVASAVAAIGDVRTLYRVSVLSLHAALHFVLALAINLQRELALSVQSREGRYKNLQQYGLGSGGMGGMGARRDGAAALLQGPAHAAAASLLHLGNVATLISFASAVYLNIAYLSGSVLCVFALAPVLLLLNQDASAWFRNLTHERRWWPVVAAVCAMLLWASALDIGLRPLLAPLGLVLPGAARVGWWWRVKNGVLALLVLPSLHSYVTFLWHARRRVATFTLLLMAPLNLLPMLLADLISTQLLAAIAIVGVAIEAVAMRKMQRAGMRLI